jgi:phosphopantetheine--protein transferase-like protein
MEDKIKNIISQYTRIAADQLNDQTVIDRSAVSSSIVLHRMYAQLAKEGVIPGDYSAIKTYGQLLGAVQGNGPASLPVSDTAFTAVMPASDAAVGIDAEDIHAMPVVPDYREDEFYTMNFSAGEIAYCILQANPLASFAGLFAAKEAIVKADESYKNRLFNTIIIDHQAGGKPLHPGFVLSISHTGNLAVAVAIKNNPAATHPQPPSTPGNPALITFTSITALVLALLSFLLVIFKTC